MRLTAMLVTLLVAGCADPYVPTKHNVCTEEQMDKAQREAAWCAANGGFTKDFCYSSAIQRNCEVRK